MIDKQAFLQKIEERSLTAAVVGLGYVGLPLATEMAKAGFRTIGFDVQQSKVDMINAGRNYIADVSAAELSELTKKGKLGATTDFSRIAEVDFIAICVPTPLDDHQQPDMRFIDSSAESVGSNLREGTAVVLESTTYPGTTEGILLPELEKLSGLKCGRDFWLGFSPERIDPGNAEFKTKNTPKVVGGCDGEATEIIAAMYGAVLSSDIHKVSSPAVAEMEKILENTYRNINIALVNELTMLCHRIGISIWEVIDAARTKPYGFEAFYPGPGLGGHCIPLDPYYLAWKAREYNFHTSLIEASGMINDRMPGYVVIRCGELLNRFKKAINGAKVLILGVAYKQNIDDYRESPALKVIDSFLARGADISYYDPWVPEYYEGGKKICSLPVLDEKAIAAADIVVITTAHSNVDYGLVQKHAKIIFDTRNAMKDIKERDNIEIL